jgi:hypothetical protein
LAVGEVSLWIPTLVEVYSASEIPTKFRSGRSRIYADSSSSARKARLIGAQSKPRCSIAP